MQKCGVMCKESEPARGKKILEYPRNPGIEKLEAFCFAAFGLLTQIKTPLLHNK